MAKRRESAALEIVRTLRKILRKASQQSRDLSRSSGLTVPQLLCLKTISEQSRTDDVTVAYLSQAVQLSSATVSRILDRLEQTGLIERTRDPRDRRKVIHTLTAAGDESLSSLPESLHERFLGRLQKLKKSRQEELLRSLETIVELMEASELDAAPMLTTDLEMRPASRE